MEKASLFLPHMMFWKLGESYPQVFHELFSLGLGKLKAFWQGVVKTNDDKLKGHPMSLEKDWEDLTIPLFVHGDGVDFSNNDNLMVYSWGCLLSSTSTLLSHWLLAGFPKTVAARQHGKSFGIISSGLLKHWQMGSTQPWIQTRKLWKRAQCSTG